MGFTVNGLDEFSLSLHEIAEMPDSTKENMLEAGGVVAIKALKQQIDALGMVDTGQLRESIAFAKKRLARNDYEPSLLIYPQGTRRGRTTKKGKKIRNAEIGFIHEFGSNKRGIPAKMWMQTAAEKSADQVAAAEAAVYDEYLKSKNL